MRTRQVLAIVAVALLLSAVSSQPSVHGAKHTDSHHSETAESDASTYNLLPPAQLPRIKVETYHFEDTAKDQATEHNDESSVKWTDAVIAIFTIVLAACGFGSGVIAWFQWKALKAQVSQLEEAVAAEKDAAEVRSIETNRSLEIAEKNAAVSQKAAEALPRAERAYVFFEDTNIEPMTGAPDGVMARKVTVIFMNHGRTPAIVLAYRLSAGFFEEPPLPSQARARDMPSGAIIGADKPWTRSVDFKFTKFEEENRKKKVVEAYLYGEIAYRDIFKADHHTWFCRRYTGRQFVLGNMIAGHLNGSD